MSGFQRYRIRKGTRGCAICGAPTKGRVGMSLSEKRASAWPVIDSTSRGFCEPHAVEVYEALREALEAKLAQPTGDTA